MKPQIIFFALILACQVSYAQDDAFIQTNRAAITSSDLQQLLYFEGISHEKFNIKSNQLNGKDFQITIKEFK